MALAPFVLSSAFSTLEDLFLGSGARDLLDHGVGSLRPYVNAAFADCGPVNIFETPEHVVVEAQMPGFEKSQVRLRAEIHRLTITAEIKEDERDFSKERYLHSEFRHGKWERTVRLPDCADTTKAEAAMNNGVLSVKFSKLAGAGRTEIVIN